LLGAGMGSPGHVEVVQGLGIDAGRGGGMGVRSGAVRAGVGDVPLRRGGFMSGFCHVFSEHRCKNTSQDSHERYNMGESLHPYR